MVLVPCGWCVPLIGVEHGREALVCTPTTSMPGFSALAAVAMPADQPTAAHRNHQRVQVGHGAQHLQPQRALAGADGFIVVGCTNTQPFGIGKPR
jgi:hypothetical protein